MFFSQVTSPGRLCASDFVNNLGVVAGDSGYEAFLHTNVGRVLRHAEAALGFEDANTIASGAISDNVMKLTDGSNPPLTGLEERVLRYRQ